MHISRKILEVLWMSWTGLHEITNSFSKSYFDNHMINIMLWSFFACLQKGLWCLINQVPSPKYIIGKNMSVIVYKYMYSIYLCKLCLNDNRFYSEIKYSEIAWRFRFISIYLLLILSKQRENRNQRPFRLME